MRISDEVIKDWVVRHNQDVQKAKDSKDKEDLSVDTIDLGMLQKAINARQEKGGFVQSIWKAVTGGKKTTSEIAMEKEIKDLFGKNGDFGGGTIERNSELNILNPLSSKGFTQSA
jgi:hypothetical protein